MLKKQRKVIAVLLVVIFSICLVPSVFADGELVPTTASTSDCNREPYTSLALASPGHGADKLFDGVITTDSSWSFLPQAVKETKYVTFDLGGSRTFNRVSFSCFLPSGQTVTCSLQTGDTLAATIGSSESLDVPKTVGNDAIVNFITPPLAVNKTARYVRLGFTYYNNNVIDTNPIIVEVGLSLEHADIIDSYNALTADLIKNQNADINNVMTDLYLPKNVIIPKSGDETQDRVLTANITWTSSNKDIIDTTSTIDVGIVKRPEVGEEFTKVTLTATIFKTGYTNSVKTFDVFVRKGTMSIKTEIELLLNNPASTDAAIVAKLLLDSSDAPLKENGIDIATFKRITNSAVQQSLISNLRGNTLTVGALSFMKATMLAAIKNASSSTAILAFIQDDIKDRIAADKVVSLFMTNADDKTLYNTMFSQSDKDLLNTKIFNLKDTFANFTDLSNEFKTDFMLISIKYISYYDFSVLLTNYNTLLKLPTTGDYSGLSSYYQRVALKNTLGKTYNDIFALNTAFSRAVSDAVAEQARTTSNLQNSNDKAVLYTMTDNALPQDTINTGFSDIGNDKTTKVAIEELVRLNVISGFGNGLFMPEANLTREQFVKMLVVALRLRDTTPVTQFTDVNSSEWYYQYITAAYNAGIIKGIEDTKFGVGMPVTREDMVTIAMRAKGLNIASTGSSVIIDDEQSISTYAKDAVKNAIESGLIDYSYNKLFMPKQNATRRQAAILIYNLIKS